VFLAFLSTPTVVGMIEKSCDTSIFYTMSEEEETHKELKVVVESLHYSFIDISARVSSLIISENLSKHDNISAAIFIPPPDLI
jgi:tetrahydromethanopterin S-methyltransferase subunit B